MRQFNTTVGAIASKSSNPQSGDLISTEGFTAIGDGGGAQWLFNGVTGQTPSQTPAQLGDALLNDASGNQWGMVLSNDFEFETFADLESSTIGNIGQKLICRERDNAEYILKPLSYSALPGDVTISNGLVGELQSINKLESYGVLTDVDNDVGVFNDGLTRVRNSGGGSLYFSSKSKAYIASDLIIPIGVKLVGEQVYIDTTNRVWWDELGSRIRLEPQATIQTQNGAGIKGCLIYRADMTFRPDGLTLADLASYSGTAITVTSASPYIGYNTILGFEWATETLPTNTPRGRVEFNNVDCTNGFNVDNDLGAWTISYNFCQPILTNTDETNIRQGVGFELINKSDWTTLVGNFTFQDIGYKIKDSNSIKLIACMADHPTDGTDLYHTGSGIVVDGDSTEIIISNCQLASHFIGLDVMLDDGAEVYLSNTVMWNMSSTGFGVRVQGGDVIISGGQIGRFSSLGGKGVLVNNANSKVSIVGGASFKNMPIAFDTPSFGEFTKSQDLVFDGVTTIQVNESIKQVASSATFFPRPNESVQSITGTTTIGTIVGGGVMPEKIITFILTDGLTINHATTLLNGSVNWTASAGSSITLQYITGNTWREMSRNEQ